MAQYDPTWLEAQYNNRARVAEHPQILARWAEASALSRERSSRRLDLRYGDGPQETLDLFPTSRAEAPVLVFLHGGYWRALDKADHSFLAPSYVADGAMVVMPNYGLCPAVTIETIALQTARALAWTWRHAALYGGDPTRIVVAGHSAGGHLAAMLACCDWKAVGRDLPAQLLRGALSISGLFELDPLRYTPFLRDDLRLTPASARALSPAAFPPPLIPLHAVVGADESEEFLRQNRLIRERWGGAAVPVCETIAGCNHFTVLHELAAPTSRVHELALQLLGLK
jgi:arylformamidase